jgi:uncharacterized membrane protein
MEQVTDPGQGKLGNAASHGARAAVWIWFLVTIAVLVVLAVGWAISHRVSPHAPDLQPELPTLPGKTPEPQNP